MPFGPTIALFTVFFASCIANRLHRRKHGGEESSPQLAPPFAKTSIGVASMVIITALPIAAILCLIGFVELGWFPWILLGGLTCVNIMSIAHRRSQSCQAATHTP